MNDFIGFIEYLSNHAKEAERFFVIMSNPAVSLQDIQDFFKGLDQEFDLDDGDYKRLIQSRKNIHDGLEQVGNLKY